MKRIGLFVVMMMAACGPRAVAEPAGDTEVGWEWAGSSWGSSGGWAEERRAEVRGSATFDGTPTDLLRGPTETLIAGHVDGVATVWRVTGARAEAIWSSDELGRDAKLVQAEDGSVRVVALVPGGIGIASLDDSSEPLLVSVPRDRSGLVSAVAGSGGELWVALGGTAAQSAQVVRVASDGTVESIHPMREGGQIVGLLRDPDRRRTVAIGNATSGDGWERCIPDDGNPAANVTSGWRITGAWIDRGRAMAGFDAGGVGCAMEIECGGGEGEADEYVMPMPTQATSGWSYGRDASQIIIGRDWIAYTHDIVGQLVAIEGDEHGVALAVMHEGGQARVVELATP